MSENKFREGEVVCIRGKDYPLLHGRIRLALEGSQTIVVNSELIRFEPGELAVTRVTIETVKGTATAHGTASIDRDPDFAGALAELSESRGCSRALRLLGYGLEVGYEELAAVQDLEKEQPRSELKAIPRTENGHRQGNGSAGASRGSHQPPLTGAQRRAIVAIARSAGREVEELVGALYPGTGLDDLTLSMASAVIDRGKKSQGNGHAKGTVL